VFLIVIIDERRILVVFIGKPQWEAGWPFLSHDNEETISKIREHFTKKFSNVNFSFERIITTYNINQINDIKEKVKKSNGLIIFTIGHYGDPGIIQAGKELLELNKPSILANLLYAGDHTFTKIYSQVKKNQSRFLSISSKNLDDFDEGIEILIRLTKLHGKKILVHASEVIKMNWPVILNLFNPERKNIIKTNPEFINQISRMSSDINFEFYTDTKGLDQAHQWRKDEKKYRDNLRKIFDVEMIRGDPQEILKYYNEIDDRLAQEIVEKWCEKALKVYPSKETILNSAKLYFAFKKLLEDKGIDIYAPDCGTFLLTGILPAYPCMAFFELSKQGYYGICESDMDCAISYLFGLTLTGRPGFVSNQSLDTSKNQITYMHCVAPSKLHGLEGNEASYEIRYHGETHLLGASPSVKFPIGEILTTIKISVFNKKIALRTGKIVDNVVDDNGCVTKVLVKGNVKKILENYDWESFGWHRVSFVGNWRNIFIKGAELLGLEIIEEDK